MKRFLALFVAVAFVTGIGGFAVAQTKTDDKKPAADMKSTDMKADKGKKMATKSASGTVKSASADSIVVAGKDKGKDAEWTFAVDDKTKVKKAGKDATAKDVTTGDSVVVRYMEHDGKSTASTVTVRAPKKDGAMAKPAEKK